MSRYLLAGFAAGSQWGSDAGGYLGSRSPGLDGVKPGMRKVVSLVEEGFAGNRCKRVGEAIAQV